MFSSRLAKCRLVSVYDLDIVQTRVVTLEARERFDSINLW